MAKRVRNTLETKGIIDELVTQINALVADVTALKSAHDTLATKLNADATVTDTDYAAAAAITSETLNVVKN